MSRSSVARKTQLGRPPGADGEQTRERIMEAALQAFAVHGYDAMSVRELTRQLEVSHNLVHHYFGSKSDLWFAAVEHRLGSSTDEILGMLEAAIGAVEPEKAIRALLERTFLEAARYPAVLAIVADEAHRGGERLDFLYQRFLGPGIEMVGRFLEAARPHPICDVDPRFLALHVMNTAAVITTQAPLFAKLGYPEPSAGDQLSDYALQTAEFLVHGLFGATGSDSTDT